MLEQRFGRAGRGISHLVVLSAAIFIMLLPVALLGTMLVGAAQLIDLEPFPLPPSEQLGRVAITIGAYLGGFVIIALVVERWYVLRIKRTTDVLRQVRDEAREVLTEWRGEMQDAILLLAEPDSTSEEGDDSSH